MITELARGWTASRIGYELSISERTVRKHVEHVYRKLNVNDRLLAVERGKELNII